MSFCYVSSILLKNKQKKNQLYYYGTSSPIVYIGFGSIEDTKKTQINWPWFILIIKWFHNDSGFKDMIFDIRQTKYVGQNFDWTS